MIEPIAAALALLLPALVVTAAASDAATFRIPNWIPMALAVAFIPAALAQGVGGLALGLHALVGVVALVAGMLLFALRWIGGGDAKLMAAAALWMGWPDVATFLAFAALAGGGLALGLLMLRGPMMRPLAQTGPRWVARLADPKEGVPYGVALAVGALAAFPASPLGAGLGF
ncbi:MAG: prepilin peptidase [Phenylobacterium sp.]|jgi:prepilin peptidase CpaA